MRRGRRVDVIWEMMGAVFAEKYTCKLYIDADDLGRLKRIEPYKYSYCMPAPARRRRPARRRIVVSNSPSPSSPDCARTGRTRGPRLHLPTASAAPQVPSPKAWMRWRRRKWNRCVDPHKDGKAIACFPYILKYGVTPCLALALANAKGDVVACEGDLQALAGMLVSKGLTGYSGWIANAVYAKGAEAFFAHCTAALNMAKSWRLMPHFETGRPYGLAASLAEGRYTAVSFGPAFDKLAVGVFDAVESGNLVDWACRTQLRAKPLFDGRRLFEAAPANHHVFIPGDRREEVRAVAYLLGVGLLEY